MSQGNYFNRFDHQDSAQKTKATTTKPVAVIELDKKVIKQQMLSSSDFETGASSMQHYAKVQPKVVELVVSKLPADADAASLKKIAGSKQVISATVNSNNKKGCDGRVQVRLNSGETADQVKFNFVRLGYKVSEAK